MPLRQDRLLRCGDARRVCLENKAPDQNLDAALRQLLSYSQALNNPLLLACDRPLLRMHVQFTGHPGHADALTKLYNTRPRWLTQAHTALDQAVALAYGWADYSPDLPDDTILRRLLALKLSRQPSPAAEQSSNK